MPWRDLKPSNIGPAPLRLGRAVVVAGDVADVIVNLHLMDLDGLASLFGNNHTLTKIAEI